MYVRFAIYTDRLKIVKMCVQRASISQVDSAVPQNIAYR